MQTKPLNRGMKRSNFLMAIHLSLELHFLLGKGLDFLFKIRPSALVFRLRNDRGEVGFRETFHLPFQMKAGLSQVLVPRLKFLGQPMPTMRPL